LEERYEKFKLSRDKFLLEEVPKNKQKVIEWSTLILQF
jgi:hypothetical protein